MNQLLDSGLIARQDVMLHANQEEPIPVQQIVQLKPLLEELVISFSHECISVITNQFMILEMIKICPEYIRVNPSLLQDKSFLLQAVQTNGLVLEFLPDFAKKKSSYCGRSLFSEY